MFCKRIARCIPSYVFAGVIERAMDTNDEVRRRRLTKLITKTEGGLKGVAQRAGLSHAALDQIIKVTWLPEKKTGGPRSRKCLGDPAARALEKAYKLPPGWMDWPLEGVDYEAYAALSEFDKAEAQVRMREAIREISQPLLLVNKHKEKDVTKSQKPTLASHNEQAESDSSAKNSEITEQGVRAVIEDVRVSNAKSNKHVGAPRKRGGRST